MVCIFEGGYIDASLISTLLYRATLYKVSCILLMQAFSLCTIAPGDFVTVQVEWLCIVQKKHGKADVEFRVQDRARTGL